MIKSILLYAFLIIPMIILGQETKSKIPNFSAKSESGKTWNSEDINSDFLVVYFYPAAMTGGCTKQACSYRDDKTSFDELDATIIGISGDEFKNLAYFKEAYELNFDLISDSDGNISKLFGVPSKDGGTISREINGENLLLSRNITTPRWTFVLNKNREIIYKNSQVNASEDSKKVLEIIKNYKE